MKVVFVDYVHTDQELGRANMPCVPRVGEWVDLDLSAPSDPKQLMFARFVVKQVEYDAKNTLQVEPWMYPYHDGGHEAGMAILHVDARDEATRAYVYRVVGYPAKETNG